MTRIAEPTMHPDEHIVEVRYQISTEDRGSGLIRQVCENHRVRYFFESELAQALKSAGLRPITFGKWLTSGPAADSSWSAYAVAVAPGNL